MGAVGLDASGRVYVGVSVEFRGVPLCHSIHAEQFLVANGVVAGESALRAVAVSHMPCGHCRQFLQEIHSAVGIHILVTSHAEQGKPTVSASGVSPPPPADQGSSDDSRPRRGNRPCPRRRWPPPRPRRSS